MMNSIDNLLIFDVETTGLPSSVFTPHIIQLSFMTARVERREKKMVSFEITKEKNYYISIDPSVEIPENITELTGITKEMCDNGVDICVALTEFYKEYENADYIIAHNIAFDSKMILFEFERNITKLQEPRNKPETSEYVMTRSAKKRKMMKEAEERENKCENPYILFNPLHCRVNKKECVCTMQTGRDITNIYLLYKTTKCTNCSISAPERKYKKTPKLIELYQFLYPNNAVPNNLHNALVDTKICMYCFLKMNYVGVEDVISQFM